MSYVAVGIAGAGVVAKGLTSLFQGRKARKIEKSNPFVTEQANPIFQKNVAIAENMAKTGLPQEQFNNQMNSIQRNQAGALTRFGRNGGGTGSLASIVRAGNDATGNLNSQDAMARQNNQRFAFGQRINLAQEQNRVWDWNKRQKFLMLQAKSEALRGASQQNLNSAFNDMTGMATTMLTGGMGGGGGAGMTSQAGLSGVQRTLSNRQVQPNQILDL